MKLLALSIPWSNGNIAIQAPPTVPTGGLETVSKLINVAFQLLFIVGFTLVIVLIVYSGIQWVISGGDKQKLQAARSRIIYAIIGLIVIIAAFFIVNTIVTLLGGTPSFFL